jgi:glycosyltransferase involved in cell wall biosynthesis
MKILFVHQNFPGQFLHLAPELARRGHEVLALTDLGNNRATTVPVVRYKHEARPVDPAVTRLGRNFTQNSDRGVSCARTALQLRQQKNYVPDVIFGHSGWGETLFLKEIWPEAKLIVYAEFYYKGQGADVGFDLEFGTANFDQVMISQSRAAHLGQSLIHSDAGLASTQWQASTFPPPLRSMIEVIFDGVDTEKVRPDPTATLSLPTGKIISAGDEVLTFVNRNLEPYRGYHIFMRALPEVLAARPNAQVVIVGGDEVSYGRAPKGSKGWKDTFLSEVRDRLDLERVHFLGKVPYRTFLSVLQISRVHAYLTYPFVLSWSMIEAMSAGCHVVGSNVPPVAEAIQDGVNGTLVNFFDIAAWSRTLVNALADPEPFNPLRRAARETAISRYDLRSVCLPKMVAFVEGFAR